MQITLPSANAYTINPHVLVEHDGQSVMWDTSVFSAQNIRDNEGIFKHINEWWAFLPKQTQKEIFDTYVDIHNAITGSSNVERLGFELQALSTRLVSFHDFNSIRAYVQYKSDIRIPGPPHLPEVFVESIDKNHTRNKTYIVSDYLNLVSLVLQLRIMVPVWGEYIKQTGKVIGTEYKEQYAFYLLNNSSIENNEAMLKLKEYVNAIVPADGNNAAILEGISSVEYSIWNLSVLIVRRLCMADVRGLDPSPVLVMHTSRHIRERVKRSDSSFRGGILKERVEATGSNVPDELQNSTMERYPQKPEIYAGDISHFRHLMRDPKLYAKRLAPTLQDYELNSSFVAEEALSAQDLHPAQKLLMQWVFDDCVVPAQGMDFIKHVDIAKALCVTHSVLWHYGHHMLAALATATHKKISEENVITGGYSKGRVSRELQDKLNELFPYQKKNRAGKQIQVVMNDIELLLDLFMKDNWSANLVPEQLAIINPRSAGVRRIMIPHDFKTKITELVIFLAQPRPVLTPQTNR